MIYVLVKEKGEAIEKRAFCGDDANIIKLIDTERQSNPTREYVSYGEDKKAEFDSFMVAEKDDNRKRWAILKDGASEREKLFAKVLGLG